MENSKRLHGFVVEHKLSPRLMVHVVNKDHPLNKKVIRIKTHAPGLKKYDNVTFRVETNIGNHEAVDVQPA
jgi:hypothetical protein